MSAEIERAKAVIRASEFANAADKLEAQLRPSIRMLSTPESADAIGISRLGGDPDLPESIEWPAWSGIKSDDKWRRSDGGPLAFLAQINLAEVPDIGQPLPRAGMLYFFYDIDAQPWGFDPQDRDGHRVIYAPGPQLALSRRPAPIRKKYYPFEPIRLTPRIEMTLPYMPDGIENFPESLEEFEQLIDSLSGGTETPRHRLLGHPEVIQNEMRGECQLVSNGIYCGNGTGHADPRAAGLLAAAADWQLLFQIDSDEDGPRWMWGDCGRIYYWIRRQELAVHDFSRSWLCLQCH